MRRFIIPTVFAHDAAEFSQRFAKLVPLFPALQIDFMDGKLVPVKGIELAIVPDLHEHNIAFEAHLMVQRPADWVVGLQERGFKKVLFHLEAMANDEEAHALIEQIKEAGMEPIVGQNPSMSIERLLPFLDEVKIVFFMGHEPGYEKIPFDDAVYEKIRHIRQLHPEIGIQVDGGVNPDSIRKAAAAGATHFNIGSFVFNSPAPEEAVQELEKMIEDIA